jgi:surface adhesion protein
VNNPPTVGAASASTIVQRASMTSTAIHDAAHNVVTAVAAGTQVHDFVTVSTGDPSPLQPTPSGNVTISWFTNGSCAVPAAATSGTFALNASGQVDASSFNFTPTTPGSYAFQASYAGDGTYAPSVGACEPLTVVDANIQITPPTAANEVGSNHVLTITVNALGGTIDAGPHTATASIASGPGSFVGPNSCTYTGGGASASCTVTITSSVVGQTVVSATSDIPVSGVTITRTTGSNPGPGGSGNATKNWVDANIVITPATAANPLGANHVLTITVNAIGGNIDAGPHTATASILSGPGSFVGSPTCTYTGGGPTASCTVTISSTVVGQTIVQATSNIPVTGVTITRTTGTAVNTASGGSGNAAKNWVDANISITPANATNPIGTTHVLTITVNALGGNIDPGPQTATASIVSGPGSFVGSPTCTYTGGGPTASCTVTITSSVPGTTVVQATSNIPVMGVTITRTTGTAANTASGGSGNAQKLWLQPDANIQLSPANATNAVGTNHVLTCHINVSPDSTTFSNAPDGTTCTVTITAGPGTPASQNCTTSGGTGSCTVTITSATAGTTTLNASTTLTVNGIVLTRTTNGTAGNSGPAQKVWVDANIQISPPTATNAVGTNHVLTITVNAINGTIDAGPHTATASIVSGPGSFVGSPSCTYTGGGASATCTVTITSTATGTTVVQATSNIPVSAQVITRTTATNPGPGGSGNANKTWVDANINITPANANNPVGTNHVLTITVNALNGTLASGTATASIVSGPGSFVGSPTCSYTGGGTTASCTVTITSSTAGTTVVSATSNIPVSGQSITRTTGTAANTAAGGSGNASKNWGDDQVTTRVLDASNTDVTGSTTIAPGTVVHDEATVTNTAGTPAAIPAPTGTVTFTLFNGTGCNGTTVSTDPNEPLNAGGVATSVTFTTPAGGGPFSYLAHYNGDANHPQRDAGCEPFTVQTPQFGPALTPGFWKNHEAATTALLPITLGNYNVNTFAKALAIFNAMKCSAPIDCLAGHELAAKLDLKGGSNPSILPVIAQADALLISLNYNGVGNYTAPTAAQKALALQLETVIDAYTNQ